MDDWTPDLAFLVKPQATGVEGNTLRTIVLGIKTPELDTNWVVGVKVFSGDDGQETPMQTTWKAMETDLVVGTRVPCPMFGNTNTTDWQRTKIVFVFRIKILERGHYYLRFQLNNLYRRSAGAAWIVTSDEIYVGSANATSTIQTRGMCFPSLDNPSRPSLHLSRTCFAGQRSRANLLVYFFALCFQAWGNSLGSTSLKTAVLPMSLTDKITCQKVLHITTPTLTSDIDLEISQRETVQLP